MLTIEKEEAMLSNEVHRLEQENERLKQEVERLQIENGALPPKKADCEHCKFFCKHYIRNEGGYHEIYSGHCIAGRIKVRKQSDVCKLFERK